MYWAWNNDSGLCYVLTSLCGRMSLHKPYVSCSCPAEQRELSAPHQTGIVDWLRPPSSLIYWQWPRLVRGHWELDQDGGAGFGVEGGGVGGVNNYVIVLAGLKVSLHMIINTNSQRSMAFAPFFNGDSYQ